MTTELNCQLCKRHMATLRDANVRNGMVVYCKECDYKVKSLLSKHDKPKAEMPDFFSRIFK